MMSVWKFKNEDDYFEFRKENKGKSFKYDISITRKCGGIGDMICLKAVIEQLVKCKLSIALYVPIEYFFIFKLLKVSLFNYWENDNEVDWQKITDSKYVISAWCPCGRHEKLTFWRPTKNRIDNFADLLCVEPVRPILKMKKGKRETKGLTIGIQIKGANVSKSPTFEFMSALSRELKGIGNVITFDEHKKIAGVECYMSDKIEDIVKYINNNIDIMVAPDSGLMHVALALNIPTVTLFGPTNGALTLKYYDNYSIVQKFKKDSCFRPCYYYDGNKFRCYGKAGDCMKEMGVFEVYNEVYKLVNKVRL